MAFKFENLKVWQRSLEFAQEIHLLTRSFPQDELYNLTSQMKRAADSVVLNIAEGSTGQSNKEFSRFLGIAIRSGIEVVACLHLARKREFLEDLEFSRFYDEISEIIKMLQGLRNAINRS